MAMNKAARSALLVATMCCLPLVAFAQPKPDLAVTTVATQIDGTSKVTFDVTVENVGTAPFSPPSLPDYVDVMLFPNQATQPDPFKDGSPDLQVLVGTDIAPGGKWTKQIVYDYGVPGDYTAWVMVDTIYPFDPDLHPEVTKANNLDGPLPVTVEKQGNFADLTCGLTVQVLGNGKVNYKVAVQNIGSELAPDCFKVDVLFDSPTCPPTGWTSVPNDTYGDDFADVTGGVAAGDTEQVFMTGEPGTGAKKACAMVDIEDCVEELDDVTNNVCGPVDYVVDDLPPETECDLDVTLFDVKVLGSVVTFCATAKNIGDKACPPYAVDLWYNSPSEPTAAGLPNHTWLSTGLAVSEEWSDCHEWTSPPNGQHSAWVWADVDNVTSDSFAANNKEGPYFYEVTVADEVPDLTVIDGSCDVLGNQLCCDTTVRNKGTKDATDFPVTIFYAYDKNPDCYEDDLAAVVSDEDTVTLAPGAQETLTFCWEAPDAGEYEAWVKVDCLGGFVESDKTNNDFGPIPWTFTPVLTEGVGIRIADFKTKTTCTNVDYTASCCNDGDTAAPPFQIDLFFHDEINPGFNPPGDRTLHVPALADADNPETWLGPGECADVVFKNDFESDTYKSWIVCDTNNDITEEDEGNNIAFVEFPVDIEECRCVDNVAIEEPCACGGETVFDGYCCSKVPEGDSPWSFEPFDECSDQVDDTTDTGDDTTDTGEDTTDDGTGGDGGSSIKTDSEGFRYTLKEDGDCTAGNGPARPAAALLVMLTLLALATRRRLT